MNNREYVIGGEPDSNDRVHLDHAELPPSDVLVRVIESSLRFGS